MKTDNNTSYILQFETVTREDNNDQRLLVDRVENAIEKKIMSLSDYTCVKLPQERDLAKSLGVSRKTIRKAIEKLNKRGLLKSEWGKGTFVVNPENSKNNICLLISDATEPFAMMSIGITSEKLNGQNYKSRLIVTKDPLSNPDLFSSEDKTLGIIVFPGSYDRNTLSRIFSHTQLRKVCIGDTKNGQRAPLQCDLIVPDNFLLTYAAIRHLINQGHKRIGMFIDHRNNIWSTEWIKGYKTAVETHGIKYDESLIFTEDQMKSESFSEETQTNNIPEFIKTWEKSGNFPTAILCCLNPEFLVQKLYSILFNKIDLTQIIPATYVELLDSNCQFYLSNYAIALDFEDIIIRGINKLISEDYQEQGLIDISSKIYVYNKRNKTRWIRDKLLASS